MSELKEFDVGLGQYCEDGSPCVVAFDADKNPRLLNEKVYLKSEADQAIAELKADYKEACDRLQTANLIKDEQLAATRHQKYRRCLAMALLSLEKRESYRAEYEEWCLKWYQRWLELAEKFKEVK